jgi:hypothetical protein
MEYTSKFRVVVEVGMHLALDEGQVVSSSF